MTTPKPNLKLVPRPAFPAQPYVRYRFPVEEFQRPIRGELSEHERRVPMKPRENARMTTDDLLAARMARELKGLDQQAEDEWDRLVWIAILGTLGVSMLVLIGIVWWGW